MPRHQATPIRLGPGCLWAKGGGRLGTLGCTTREPYRELNGWGNQYSARIRYDDGDEVDLPEERYRAQGYDPPFDKLPWKAQASVG
jgi:hypothetical protein